MDIHQPPNIGLNIMVSRKQKKMSLDTLSKRSGVSKSMLSQIEQEKTNPTVATVWKIARALNIAVEELLLTNVNYQVEVQRSEDAPIILSDDGTCTIQVISPIHMTDNLELYNMTFKPYGKLCSSPHYPNSEEFLTVISGKFKVTAGNNSSTLCEGDTGRYRVDIDHEIQNLSDSEGKAFLVVWYPKK